LLADVDIGSYRVRVGGSYMYYRVAGAGPPLVLIHGFSASSVWWRRNMKGLATRHRVYALDLVGFGRSWPKHHFSLDYAVDAIVAWMRAVDLERADVCGHSMGGHLAIHLTTLYPELVRCLVLADASGLPLGDGLFPLAVRGLRSNAAYGFGLAPTVVGTALQAGPLVLWGALRGLLADDVNGVLARIAAPTLVIWGEIDVLVPLASGRMLQEAIPGARLAVIPQAGHNAMYERPEIFNRLVLEFLDEDG